MMSIQSVNLACYGLPQATIPDYFVLFTLILYLVLVFVRDYKPQKNATIILFTFNTCVFIILLMIKSFSLKILFLD